MPRSYSFDHFQVPAAEPRSRSLRRKDKQDLAGARQQAHSSPVEGEVHYGRSHAQTQALFHAHQRERQEAQKQKKAASRSKRARPEAAQARAPMPGGTAPIGALPRTEEQPPRGRLMDLMEEASRQLEVLQAGVGDVTRAAARLASLPLEVVRIAARRLRLVHG